MPARTRQLARCSRHASSCLVSASRSYGRRPRIVDRHALRGMLCRHLLPGRTALERDPALGGRLRAASGPARADDAVTVIVGAIFKRQAEYNGRPHEWVAPPPAVAAISVLEALSAGHRAQAGRPQLWLRRRQTSGRHRVAATCAPVHWASRRRCACARCCSVSQSGLVCHSIRARPGGSRRIRAARPSRDLPRCATARPCSRWPNISATANAPSPTTAMPAPDYRLNQEIEVRDPRTVGRGVGAHARHARPGWARRRRDHGQAAALQGCAAQAGHQELRAPAGGRRPRARRMRLGVLRLQGRAQRLPGQRDRPQPRAARTIGLRALQELRVSRRSIGPIGSSRSVGTKRCSTSRRCRCRRCASRASGSTRRAR